MMRRASIALVMACLASTAMAVNYYRHLMLIPSPQAPSPDQPPYAGQLAAWYPLTSDLTDASGNGITATWHGGAGSPTFVNGAILLPGNRAINIYTNTFSSNLNISATLVIRANQRVAGGGTAWAYVAKAGVANSFNAGVSSGNVFLRLQTNNANRVVQTGSSIGTNGIVTLAITFSGTQERAYTNGIQWAQNPGWTNDAVTPASIIRCGEFNGSYVPTNTFVYEILLYTNALTSNQVLEVHQWCDARD